MAISPSSSTAASSGTSSFNVDGIVSGLKTADIITALMKLAKAPLNQLTKQQTALQTRDTAYQAISSQLVTFQTSVQNLLLSTAVNSKLATSVTPAIATATATSTALNGSFSVTVANVATATSANSSGVLGTAANLAPATVITSAGLAIAPTAGNFTVNGIAIAVVGTDTWSSLQGKITAATAGAVTLNLGANSVSLTSATPVQLGSPTDTSNFLTATNLLTAPQTGAGPYTVASNALLGEAATNNPLTTAGLNVAIAASGTFAVNGVAIAWTNTDSVNTILTRINSSAAGVSATYDPKLDKVKLTNTATGAQNISLVDTTGNLLGALHVLGAPQTFGVPAQYTTTQNGVVSAPQFSNSNAVVGALPGVNVTLVSAGTTSITVAQDTTTATANINAFITQFNSLQDLLLADTSFTTTTTTGGTTVNGVTTGGTTTTLAIPGVLAGDSAITGLSAQLYSLVSAPAIVPLGAAYVTMASIGVSTGAWGSAPGSTNHLQLDSAKLTAALQANPQAVGQVLNGLTGSTSSTAGANPWIQTETGTPFGQTNAGKYKVTFNPIGNTLTSIFTNSAGTVSPATTSTITAGGLNTSLIPGVSIQALAVLPVVSGTDTINYSVSQRGLMQSLNDFINTAKGSSGIFVSEHTDATSGLANFASQIANQNVALAQQQTTLQAQFTAMEVALGKLQAQSASLAQYIGTTTNTGTSSSSS